jgi:hypothetical protein
MEVMIGVDPHKGSHTATMLDRAEREVTRIKVRDRSHRSTPATGLGAPPRRSSRAAPVTAALPTIDQLVRNPPRGATNPRRGALPWLTAVRRSRVTRRRRRGGGSVSVRGRADACGLVEPQRGRERRHVLSSCRREPARRSDVGGSSCDVSPRGRGSPSRWWGPSLAAPARRSGLGPSMATRHRRAAVGRIRLRAARIERRSVRTCGRAV